MQEYLGFILALNEAVQGKALDAECAYSPLVNSVVQMLKKFDDWVTEIPPTEQPQRFGNRSFRTWHERLQQVRHAVLSDVERKKKKVSFGLE